MFHVVLCTHLLYLLLSASNYLQASHMMKGNMVINLPIRLLVGTSAKYPSSFPDKHPREISEAPFRDASQGSFPVNAL